MSPTKLLPFPLLVPYYQQNDTTTESYKNSGGSERVVYFFCWNETNAMPLSSFTKLLSIKYMENIMTYYWFSFSRTGLPQYLI